MMIWLATRTGRHTLATEVRVRCSGNHEPHRQRGDEVEVEPQHHQIKCAMDGTVQCPKRYKDPRSAHLGSVHLTRDEEIESERIEEHRNLEQVL